MASCFLMWFQHLESVIKARIPGISSSINKNINELEADLDYLGRPVAIDAGVRTLYVSSIWSYNYMDWVHVIIWSFFVYMCNVSGTVVYHLRVMSCIWPDFQGAFGWRVILRFSSLLFLIYNSVSCLANYE